MAKYLDMPGGRKRKERTKKRKKKSRKRRKKRKTRRRKKQKGGDKANKYWGRDNFFGKYALPNLLPKKLKKDLWIYRTAKYGIPLPWKNKK